MVDAIVTGGVDGSEMLGGVAATTIERREKAGIGL